MPSGSLACLCLIMRYGSYCPVQCCHVDLLSNLVNLVGFYVQCIKKVIPGPVVGLCMLVI